MIGTVVLGETEVGSLKPGDVLRVEISFDYRCAEDTTAHLWAWLALMQVPMPIGRDMENAPAPGQLVQLKKAVTWTTWEGYADIEIPTSGKNNGFYQLGVEINGEEVKIDNAVEITGMPEAVSIWALIADMMPLLIIVMMMAMIMPMTRELGEGKEYY